MELSVSQQRLYLLSEEVSIRRDSNVQAGVSIKIEVALIRYQISSCYLVYRCINGNWQTVVGYKRYRILRKLE